MQLRYSFRVDPTVGQCKRAARVFGCKRAVWNAGLALIKPVKESNKALGNPRKRLAEGPWNRVPKNPDLSKIVITEAKRSGARPWLADAPVGVLQQSLRDLDKAWAEHERSKAGMRPGPKVGEPSFKSKYGRQSARFTRSDRFKITDGRLHLPKIGDLKVTWTRTLPSDPTSVTLIKDPAGRYWASFVIETDSAADVLPELDADIGIDLGLKHFAVLDGGRRIDHPKWLRRAEKKLRKAQRVLSRKAEGSHNRNKACVKVARQHAHVANARRDWQHKLSARLVGENQAVYVETLDIRAMARTHLAKSVHDSGWAQFVNMLEYKAARAGRMVIGVDRDFPSTQLCSDCRHRTGPRGLPGLSVRRWTCSNCGTTHDRDINSGRNLKTEGRRIRAAMKEHHRPGDVPAPTG